MEDEGWAGYIWDRSTIKVAVAMVGLAVFAIFTGISSYHYHLNNLKRHYLEETASEILGTRVTIGGLYWRPSENIAILADVEISNPPGFDIPIAIYVRAIRMRMDSVSFSPMVFSQITISRSLVNLTFGRDASNLMILHSNMARTKPVLAADGKPVAVTIKDLRTADGMSVRPDVVPADRPLSATDAELLHLTAIGEKEKGIPVAQAVTLVFDQIIRSAFMAEAKVGALEPMSNTAIYEIKSSLDMGPDFVGLASRGPVKDNVDRK